MPRQTQATSGIKRGVAQDAARQRDIADPDAKPPRGKVGANPPPPAREASQSSSKVGVQKQARDASSPGVSTRSSRGNKGKKS